MAGYQSDVMKKKTILPVRIKLTTVTFTYREFNQIICYSLSGPIRYTIAAPLTRINYVLNCETYSKNIKFHSNKCIRSGGAVLLKTLILDFKLTTD